MTKPNRRDFITLSSFLAASMVAAKTWSKTKGEIDPFELDGSLNVLNYNVFKGFRGGSSFEKAVAWINAVEPDILALQELVGWNEQRLQTTAARWGHKYAVTLKQGGYNVGLTSNKPIQVIERRLKGFWHGCLHCRTHGVDVIVTHLWPGSIAGQVREAAFIRDRVAKLHKEGRQVILMGDFNAHSAADKAMLDRQEPLIKHRSSGKKPSPFIKNGKFIYDVMDTIMQAPLEDMVRKTFDKAHPNATYGELLQLGSFPTLVLNHSNTVETQRGLLERIDFILTTPELSRFCKEAKVFRTPAVLEEISDHYPVYLELASEKH